MLPNIKQLFDAQFLPEELFSDCIYPWEALKNLQNFMSDFAGKFGKPADSFPGTFIQGAVKLGKQCTIEPGAVIFGPAVLGTNVTVRSCAYIRGNAWVGDNCVIGHATEIKNAILLAGVRADHFNYIADSVLGFKVHLGAGAILANTKLPKSEVVIKMRDKKISTGLEKFGAAVGDNAEIGCNAVLNPGSVVGQRSIVYPLVSWRGVLPDNTIAKTGTEIIFKHS